MKHRLFLVAVTAVVAAPATAHPEHGPPPPTLAAQDPAAAERAAVQAVLSQYKAAIERLDARGTEQLFTAASAIFETGGKEGTYANYLAHHLGPELHEFKSFRFSDYKVDVHLLGPAAAHAIETYKYRIETKSGEVVERLGVATSVLVKENGRWKIVMMHNSGRKPRAQ
ncbi:MAG: nuclear transport factor 2 family protein [Pseudomonadota bacterium]|nr:nuclear transport factor 2 family protein [Pseudomonadota bacterium]